MSYFVYWLILSGLGILFGFFPGHLLFARYVEFAVCEQKKDVAKWVIRIASGDPVTRQFMLSKPKDYVTRKDVVILPGDLYIIFKKEMRSAIMALVIGLGISESIFIYIFIVAHHDIVILIIENLGFPLFYSLTIFLPYILVKRHIQNVGTYHKDMSD